MNKLFLYSWNILNPQPFISKMSWKKFTDDKTAFTIANIDNDRFISFRYKAILKIINHWFIQRLNNNIIICLQEVNEFLLDKLKEIYPNNNIISTKIQSEKDYRVIIVSNNITISNYKDIDFSSISDISSKSGLLATIQINNKIIQIINVHLHWTWNEKQIQVAGAIINEQLDEQYDFIIAGDFNKSIDTLNYFLDQFDCLQYIKPTNKSDKYTSIEPLTKKYEIIDHILLSSEIKTESNANIKIISKTTGYKIFYNFKKILKMKNLNIHTWLDKRLNKDISDHKPIYLEICL